MKQHLLAQQIIGKHVFGQHGREVGIVEDLGIDTQSWTITALRVKLERTVLDDLRLKRFVFKTQLVDIPVAEVSGVSDALVLQRPLEKMIYAGGVPADQIESPEPKALPE